VEIKCAVKNLKKVWIGENYNLLQNDFRLNIAEPIWYYLACKQLRQNQRNYQLFKIPKLRLPSKKYIDTKQSNKKNNQNSKDKRQDYNMKRVYLN